MNTTSFEGELELYASACACASKEAELAIACLVYWMRHSAAVADLKGCGGRTQGSRMPLWQKDLGVQPGY